MNEKKLSIDSLLHMKLYRLQCLEKYGNQGDHQVENKFCKRYHVCNMLRLILCF